MAQRASIPLLASLLASCVGWGGRWDVHFMGEADAPSQSGARNSATIDFRQRIFVADLQGRHYVGVLVADPSRPGAFRFAAAMGELVRNPDRIGGVALAPTGEDRLDCGVYPADEDRWTGTCTDTRGTHFDFHIGRWWHV